MKPALLLVDLQNDFLAVPGLQPAAPEVCACAALLLEGFRTQTLPVIHARLTIRRDDDRRMPHWRQAGKWACVEGTHGHDSPAPLRPLPGETTIGKTFFSAFEDGALEKKLREFGCDSLIVAGVHLHGCVRSTALDAYQRGFAVCVAEDATASDDPLHAAITRRYLNDRAVQFDSVASILHRIARGTFEKNETKRMILRSPRDSSRVIREVAISEKNEIARAIEAAHEAWTFWRTSKIADRAAILLRLAETLIANTDSLARQMAEEIGKPVTQAAAEVRRSEAILRDVVQRAAEPLEVQTSPEARYRFEPLGVVAVVTPWNNPLAIPLGKIAPALLYGNCVVWKPAPAGTLLAMRLMNWLGEAGCPADIVKLITGDHTTARLIAVDAGVDAVTLSGSLVAGYAIQEICARRHIPLQAELGGNNAAIVWDDADLSDAASRIAEAAFGFAGQRCTANRRVIVSASCLALFVQYLESAVAALVWGDPLEPATQIGPLISAAKRDQVAALIARTNLDAGAILTPHISQAASCPLHQKDTYYPPTILVGPDLSAEIVQEESFGPVLVVQRANDFDQALELCNGVRQGLVAALFSSSPILIEQFLKEARAGVLKLNRATADADALSPFGGWKASGIGSPEHGPSDREFYTRTQTVYHHPAQVTC